MSLTVSDKVAGYLKRMPVSPFYAILDYVVDLGLQKEAVYLNMGEPHFDTPIHIREAAKKALDGGYTAYTPQPGIFQLREAIAEKLKRENGIEVDPKTEVFVTNGAQAAVYVALKTLIDPGDEVIVPSPYYPPYVINTEILGGKPIIIPFDLRDDLTLEPEEFEKHINEKTKAIFIHSPNNPIGGVISEENLKAISEVALRHRIPVVTDECYEKILFDGVKHTSVASLPGMKDLTLTISSFSKSYSMTGWRVGYLAAEASFVKSFAKIHHTINICVNSVAQWAAYAALTGPHDFMDKWQKVYETNRGIILEALEKSDVTKLAVRPTGTFYVFLDITKLGMSSEVAVRFFVREAGVVLTPGSGFGSYGEGYVRMSFATQTENVEKAISRLVEVLEKSS